MIINVVALKSNKDHSWIIEKVYDLRDFVNNLNKGRIEQYRMGKPYQVLRVENYTDTKTAEDRLKFLNSDKGIKYLNQACK
ncbi:hypothetical protein KC660_00140 [Candidatus Dojkabacteria bacterium]|uniref:Uncharacterized protein n=1 Tax=Candidatus Dojkabacteria bacterium TaxID=2099670 RepID=A0A955L2Q8_9BACT|nr:hypothetical protein [Candidatus Dojkabacteria bacterium]